MSGAPEQRRGHYPGASSIEAYGSGGFRFAGMSHRGSILVLPSGIHAWDAVSAADIDAARVAAIAAEARGFELMVVGTGEDLVPLSAEVREIFRGAGVRAEVMSTSAALRTYNVLFAEGRAVAGAFLAVD
ncbi:MAG: MTH938/NDUFAF3 family protein [Hyphomicrobiales bacterium]